MDETSLNGFKNKNNEDDYAPVKKFRSDKYESESDVPSTSASSKPSTNTKLEETDFLSLSEQTASTSSSSSSSISSNLDWINLFRDSNMPIPNNDFQNPRQLLCHLVPSIDATKLPNNLDDFDICRLIYQLMSSNGEAGGGDLSASTMFLTQREKLLDINTIEQCVDLIDKSENIIVLTGAGCSVSCGIPDFRSRDGVYARLRVDFPDLPDPQAMFDIFYFEHDPRPFFKFAKEIYPGQFKPSLSHMFIKKLEENRRLLRNYTQNIDTLEMTAGIKNVIQCHGKAILV